VGREKLTKIRQDKGFTVKDMASKVGITPRYYLYIERGERKADIEILKRIAGVLKVNDINLF
jgi:transcriptional regulator with XRE-family HTH domain